MSTLMFFHLLHEDNGKNLTLHIKKAHADILPKLYINCQDQLIYCVCFDYLLQMIMVLILVKLFLACVQLVIPALLPEQFIMASPLYNFTVLKNHDCIGIAYRRKSVRYNKGSPVFISLSIPCSICFSVLVSTELVASSRTSIGAFESAALAILSSWRCPCERFTPSPSIIVS